MRRHSREGNGMKGPHGTRTQMSYLGSGKGQVPWTRVQMQALGNQEGPKLLVTFQLGDSCTELL